VVFFLGHDDAWARDTGFCARRSWHCVFHHTKKLILARGRSMVENGGETHRGHFDATSVSMEYESQETGTRNAFDWALKHWFTN
jgi:hypothetical protein